LIKRQRWMAIQFARRRHENNSSLVGFDCARRRISEMPAKNKNKPTTKECAYFLEMAHRPLHVKLQVTVRD
jgi:hypothetical protein